MAFCPVVASLFLLSLKRMPSGGCFGVSASCLSFSLESTPTKLCTVTPVQLLSQPFTNPTWLTNLQILRLQLSWPLSRLHMVRSHSVLLDTSFTWFPRILSVLLLLPTCSFSISLDGLFICHVLFVGKPQSLSWTSFRFSLYLLP